MPIVSIRGSSPTTATGQGFHAMPFMWVALHGYCAEVNDQDSAGLDLASFSSCDGAGLDQTDCTTLADAIDNHISFTGTLGRVRRTTDDDIECPSDTDMRQIGTTAVHNDGNMQDDGDTIYRVPETEVSDFSDFLRDCGGCSITI